MRDLLEWGLGQISPLEIKRNDAIHAPYTISFETGKLRMKPKDSTGSEKAKNLSGKNLEQELALYAERTVRLSQFMRDVRLFGASESRLLPAKPQLKRQALLEHLASLKRTRKASLLLSKSPVA